MSTIKDVTKQEIEVDAEKRAFMKKAGKYAAVGVGMAALMTPSSSVAGCSSTGNNGNGKPVGCGAVNSGK